MEIKIPLFFEENYFDNYSNKDTRVVKIPDAHMESFGKYCDAFEDMGAKLYESRVLNEHSYAAFSFETYGVFINYFSSINELTIVVEENCNYFSYLDEMLPDKVQPQITQPYLEDNGSSHVIRLTDGRFIIIDGGWNFKPDAIELMRVLKEGSLPEKPVIAAWIMTHAHCDHYYCFNTFCELYDGEFIVEKYMLNFPDPDKRPNNVFKTIPYIKDESYNFEDTSGLLNMNVMYDNFKKLGAKFYMLHTGQVYKIGESKIEILACIDDVVSQAHDVNSESAVFKMEFCGQTILWTGDTAFSDVKLSDKYETYLKADILQAPHHGFGSGTVKEEIRAYEYIKPSVCMLPVSDFRCYTTICPYKEGTRYLMTSLGIDELIIGDKTRTINMPYTPPAYKKDELKRKYLRGLNNAGSTCWVYMNLNTSNKEDFEFSLLGGNAPIYLDLTFEDNSCSVGRMKVIKEGRYRTIDILDENDVEKNILFFSWAIYDKEKIPENCNFSVRFLSDEPFIVSHKSHQAAYRADNVF